jgi:hypothetical protein
VADPICPYPLPLKRPDIQATDAQAMIMTHLGMGVINQIMLVSSFLYIYYEDNNIVYFEVYCPGMANMHGQ